MIDKDKKGILKIFIVVPIIFGLILEIKIAGIDFVGVRLKQSYIITEMAAFLEMEQTITNYC